VAQLHTEPQVQIASGISCIWQLEHESRNNQHIRAAN